MKNKISYQFISYDILIYHASVINSDSFLNGCCHCLLELLQPFSLQSRAQQRNSSNLILAISVYQYTTERLSLAYVDSPSGTQFPSVSSRRWCHCKAMCQLNKGWQETGLWDFGPWSTNMYSHIPLFSACPLLLTSTQHRDGLGNETELQLHTHLVWLERF